MFSLKVILIVPDMKKNAHSFLIYCTIVTLCRQINTPLHTFYLFDLYSRIQESPIEVSFPGVPWPHWRHAFT